MSQYPGYGIAHYRQFVMEAECGQCEGGGIKVRAQGNTIDDRVAGIPPAFGASSIEEHFRSESEPVLQFAAADQSLALCAL
jgi:hypothetical protein